MAFFFRSSHTQLKIDNLTVNLDRNKTGSRRFKPNSRTILMDEQSNHFYRLQQKEMMNRHRGHNQ